MINRLPHPPLVNRLMEWLAVIANRGDGWLLGVLLAKLYNPRAEDTLSLRFIARMVLIVWLVTLTVEYPLKLLFRRPRPFVQLTHARMVGAKPNHYSFPSGHTAASFASAWLLRHHFPRWRWLHWGLALLVACNRVYLGAHFPGDTVAGAFSGVGLAALFSRLPWLSEPKK